MGTWDVEIIEELNAASGGTDLLNWPFNVFTTRAGGYLNNQASTLSS